MSHPIKPPTTTGPASTATISRLADEPQDGDVIDARSTDTASDAPQPEQDKIRLDLSFTGVVGSSLAAITAAYLGSKLGVAGTIIGAGLGSVISAVAAALYTASLRQSRSGLRTAMAQLRPGVDGAPSTAEVATPNESRMRALVARLRPHGKKIAVCAAAIFVITIAAITTYEGLAGKSLSGTEGGTSVSRVFGANDTRTPTPSEPAPRDGQTAPRPSDEATAPRDGSAPTSETGQIESSTPTAPSSGSAPTSAAPDNAPAPTTGQPAPTPTTPQTAAPTTATPNTGGQGGATQDAPTAPK